ncbi:hypothetical protein EN802_13980 [bacterium M00.F.Ca.ET.159.01.1.1]|nr:hypothetical protein EN802_13980 [bacterium M00.F.Ca.ET.159.01.1.1]
MPEIPKELVFRPTRDETYIAFAAAVDAWSKVEWQMMFLFNSVSSPTILTSLARSSCQSSAFKRSFASLKQPRGLISAKIPIF